MSRSAVYAGSFDPPTRGHLDIIKRGLSLFDHLVVAVGRNVDKSPLFTSRERVLMIQNEFAGEPRLEVTAFGGLAVEFANSKGAGVLLRGVRSLSDFESEFHMALTNSTLDPSIETIFLAPSEAYAFVSSRLVKEVIVSGGNVERFLTPGIASALRKRMEENRSE
ncbi:MAG: pantetheine-phosphate adenylyltransferase [Planctomycetota bacterium]|jgi:pantetheine-phosphate adenylyltransferase